MVTNINNASSSERNTTGLAVTDKTVTVGFLHSLTGTMAISETGAQEVEKLAIKQINDMQLRSLSSSHLEYHLTQYRKLMFDMGDIWQKKVSRKAKV